jgi:hypothetical protein
MSYLRRNIILNVADFASFYRFVIVLWSALGLMRQHMNELELNNCYYYYYYYYKHLTSSKLLLHFILYYDQQMHNNRGLTGKKFQQLQKYQDN